MCVCVRFEETVDAIDIVNNEMNSIEHLSILYTFEHHRHEVIQHFNHDEFVKYEVLHSSSLQISTLRLKTPSTNITPMSRFIQTFPTAKI